MLDLPHCPHVADTVSAWTALASFLTRFAAHWLTKPLLVLSGFTILAVLAGFIPRRFLRRFVRSLILGLALVYLAAIYPPTINLAEKVLAKPIPRDSGQVADAVVILGRGSELATARVDIAATLWREQRARLIFTSGVWDAPHMLKMLQNRGIPEQFLKGEGCSRTTYENAKFTAEALKPQGVQRILLVTDAPHMLRSILTFQSFGFSVIPIPSSGLTGLSRSRRATLVAREYLGLASYGAMGRLALSPDGSFWLSQSSHQRRS